MVTTYRMSAYIRELERERLARAEVTTPPSSRREARQDALREQFLKWWASLPAPTRERAFSMREFEEALGARADFISPVLIALGWRRHRVWANARSHYHRVWLPPSE